MTTLLRNYVSEVFTTSAVLFIIFQSATISKNNRQLLDCREKLKKPVLSLLILFRAFERTILIWFKKVVQEGEEGNGFLDDKKKMFSLADTHAFLDIIALCTHINHESIQEHMEYFTQQLSGLSPRLAETYCVFRLVSHLVSMRFNSSY